VPDQLSNDLASLRIERDEARPTGRGGVVRAAGAFVAVVAIGGGAYASWPYVEARVFATEVDIGEIVTVSPAQSQTQLTAAGHVVARTLAHVAATTSGRVARVHVVEGQEVEAGALLVELDASDQASAVASARARVLAAQARAEQARATLADTEQQLARARTLVASGAGARSTVEDLEARIAVARGAVSVATADVRTAQAELHALQLNDDDLRIVAPLAGTVLTDPIEIGEIVSPTVELMQIADFSSLVVEIDVPEARLSLVRVGGPCEIVLDAFPGRRFRGEVLEIGRRVNRSTAAVPVRVRFAEPAEGVLPDMSSHVGFLREELTEEQLRAAERTVVPVNAIVSRGGRDVVFEVQDRVATERPVRVGETTTDGVVLLSGPEPGTRVVLDPPSTLASGSTVREREE
jgi:RND family efflux transporter MFP subunit